MSSAFLNHLAVVATFLGIVAGGPLSWLAPQKLEGSLGSVTCATNGLHFSLQHSAALKLAFVDPSLATNAKVHKVVAGKSSNKACVATNSNGFSSLFIPMGDCGTAWDREENTLTFRNSISITVRTRYGPMYDDTVFVQPIVCSTDATYNHSVEATVPFPVESLMDDTIYADFKVPIDNAHGTVVVDQFLNFKRPKQVIALTFDLFESERDLYGMLVDHCFVTPSAARDSQPRYDVMERRACIEGINLNLTEFKLGRPQTLRMLVPHFEDVEVEKIYVHCQVNVCTKAGSQAPCTQSCNRNRNWRVSSEKFQAKEFTSMGITVNQNLEPGVIVRPNGQVVVQPN